MKKRLPMILIASSEALTQAGRIRGRMSLGVTEFTCGAITYRYTGRNGKCQVPMLLNGQFNHFRLDVSNGKIDNSILHQSTSALIDYVVFSQQNPDNLAYAMVIWPTGPGSTPEDSNEEGFLVSGNIQNKNQSPLAPSATLSPNPGYGMFQVRSSLPTETTVDIYIYQADGTLVEQRKQNTEAVLDLGHLQEGVYQYRIAMENGIESTGELQLKRE